MREFLRRDPIQPRATGPADVTELASSLERDRERLRQQIGRHLGIKNTLHEVRQQPLGPTVVQLTKDTRVVA